jgi:iron(III) transport system substrate-binding protein
MAARILIAAFALLLAACGQSQSGGAERVVNVYSGRHYDSDQRIYDAFTAKTGIQVRVLPAGGDQLLERLKAEGDATQADLIVTADAGNLYRLAEAGLFQPSDTPALQEAVPEAYRDPQGRWWAFSKRARVIAYRKGIVDPASLTSLDVLAEPRFHGQVCARSSTNVYNLSMLASRIERDGRPAALTWARAVRNNFARDPQGGDVDQVRAIAAGVCEVAITNHYYFARLIPSTAPEDQAVLQAVAITFADKTRGAHINVSGAGVSAYAQHRVEAIALLEFLVSPEAQAMLPPGNEEFPIRPGVPIGAVLEGLGTFTEERMPLEALGRHQAEAAAVFEEAGWR